MDAAYYPVIVKPTLLKELEDGDYNIDYYLLAEDKITLSQFPIVEQIKYFGQRDYNSYADYFASDKALIAETLEISGKYDKQFASFIKDNTPYTVYLDRRIQHYGTDTEDEIISHYYYPDIIVMDEESKVIIDVEIDEPYSNSNGQPTHFINIRSKRNSEVWCSDHTRDDFFASIGIWTVRLAEEQVALYPDKCVELLKSIINSWKTTPLGKVDITLPLLERWTHDDAIVLSKQGHRQTYSWQLTDTKPNKIKFGMIENPDAVNAVARQLWDMFNDKTLPNEQ